MADNSNHKKLSPSAEDNTQQPLIDHLIELRSRLLKSLIAIIITSIPLLYFSNELYQFVAQPLMTLLPEGTSMIATEVASPFLSPFKLSVVAAIFCAIPILLFQLWSFIAPGLYQREKKVVIPLLASSIMLFYGGVIFAYYVVFPLIFGFFSNAGPEGVAYTPDIARFLDIVLKLFFAFGFAFEIPIATIIIVWMGLTTPQKLAEKRPFVIVGCFFIGMLLTPPDVISQVLLAIPMWLLFECGIIFSKAFDRSKTH